MTYPIIHVVDDDEAIRASLELFLDLHGYCVRSYPSGDEFLQNLEFGHTGCILLDVHMPGISGLEVLKELRKRRCPLPVIIVTGQGDIEMAIGAMKSGAADFIEKPYSSESILETIKDSIRSMEASAQEQEKTATARAKVASLSRRENEVLRGLLSALPNKLIAYELGISIRTVEVYRAKVMDKLDARGLSDAVRIALLAGVEPLEEGAAAVVYPAPMQEAIGVKGQSLPR